MTSDETDPFRLAANYSSSFILIHMFMDGNGRMFRLIFNVLLLNYTETAVVFGESHERDGKNISGWSGGLRRLFRMISLGVPHFP